MPLEAKDGKCVVALRGRPHGDTERGDGRREPDPRAWPPLQPLRLRAVRIVFDVSPLSHPRSGIGKYLRGSLAGSPRRPPASTRSSPSRRRARRGRRRFPRRSTGIPVELSLQFLPFAHFWRQGWSRLGRPAVERFLGPIDVLHFSDWMYPPQRAGIRATTIHDLVPLRHPEWVQGRTRRMHTREVPERGAHLRPRLRELGVHGARRRRAARRARGAGARRAAGSRRGLHERRREGRARRRLRPHRRDARAAQEPRGARRGARAARPRRPPARGRRRRGLGRAAGARPAGHRPARLRGRRRAGPPLPRRGRRSRTRRASRASGCR